MPTATRPRDDVEVVTSVHDKRRSRNDRAIDARGGGSSGRKARLHYLDTHTSHISMWLPEEGAVAMSQQGEESNGRPEI